MAQIRNFTKDDIPQIADLYQKTFLGDNSLSIQTLRMYIDEVFFHNPWLDEDLSSLVYQDDDGRIAGFLGVIPRRMLLNGRPIRVAVSSSFMVEPGSRYTLAGVELLRRFFAGPQDLSMTDGANDASRRLWERLGGSVALLYSMRWRRILQPCRYAAYLVRKRRAHLRPLALLAAPCCHIADALGARIPPNRFRRSARAAVDENLDVATLLACSPKLSGGEALRPLYDRSSLEWLLEMAAKKKVYGTLRTRVVRHMGRDILGWWLYYLNPNGVSEVLQIGATKMSIHMVINRLFYDAWRHGSIAVAGRFEPRFVQELLDNYCSFTCGTWMLVHSRNAALLQAIYHGDAALTQLEGERWTCFLELLPAVSP